MIIYIIVIFNIYYYIYKYLHYYDKWKLRKLEKLPTNWNNINWSTKIIETKSEIKVKINTNLKTKN